MKPLRVLRGYLFTILGIAIGVAGLVALGAMSERIVRFIEGGDRFVWHCRNEIKALMDEQRKRMGNIPPRTWAILAINEWIGLPSGMADLNPLPK